LGLRDLQDEYGGGITTWNGYKLMSGHVTDAVRHTRATFPPNIRGEVEGNPQERAQVFHDLGRTNAAGKTGLVPGRVNIGLEDEVEVPPGIRLPTARVSVHQHPYTGSHNHDEPSLEDHLIARQYPNVEHIVQIPTAHPSEANPYITYTGAVPPRYYTLVENPANLRVSPPSPDGGELPPFHPHPG
jgi:hypothetical protein